MRDARQQRELRYIGRVRPELLDQRLDTISIFTAISLSAKVFSTIPSSSVTSRARLGIRDSALGGQHVGPALG